MSRGNANIPPGGRTGQPGARRTTRFDLPGEILTDIGDEQSSGNGDVTAVTVDLFKEAIHKHEVKKLKPTKVTAVDKISLHGKKVKAESANDTNLAKLGEVTPDIEIFKTGINEKGVEALKLGQEKVSTVNFTSEVAHRLTGSGTSITICDSQGNASTINVLTPDDFTAVNVVKWEAAKMSGLLRQDAQGAILLLKEDAQGNIAALVESAEAGAIKLAEISSTGTPDLEVASFAGDTPHALTFPAPASGEAAPNLLTKNPAGTAGAIVADAEIPDVLTTHGDTNPDYYFLKTSADSDALELAEIVAGGEYFALKNAAAASGDINILEEDSTIPEAEWDEYLAPLKDVGGNFEMLWVFDAEVFKRMGLVPPEGDENAFGMVLPGGGGMQLKNNPLSVVTAVVNADRSGEFIP